jgi:hypothetical protein
VILVLVLVLGPWIFVLVLRLSFLAAPHHRDAVNTSLSRAGTVPIAVSRRLPISTVLKRPEISLQVAAADASLYSSSSPKRNTSTSNFLSPNRTAPTRRRTRRCKRQPAASSHRRHHHHHLIPFRPPQSWSPSGDPIRPASHNPAVKGIG